MCKIYILANLILLLGVDKVFYNAGHTEGLFLSGTLLDSNSVTMGFKPSVQTIKSL